MTNIKRGIVTAPNGNIYYVCIIFHAVWTQIWWGFQVFRHYVHLTTVQEKCSPKCSWNVWTFCSWHSEHLWTWTFTQVQFKKTFVNMNIYGLICTRTEHNISYIFLVRTWTKMNFFSCEHQSLISNHHSMALCMVLCSR